MKKSDRPPRQLFVLTAEEKKAAACVLFALVLGAGTQHYRALHPRPPAPLTPKEQRAAMTAARAKNALTQSARRSANRTIPTPEPDDD